MIGLKRIFTECFADSFIVRKIFEDQLPAHLYGITEVAKALKDFTGNNYIIGLIDTDRFKREPHFILQFTEKVEDVLNDQGLLIMKIPNTNRYIIRLHPAFEKWIWRVADECGVKPEAYGYKTWKDLKTSIKTEDVYEDEHFDAFIKAVIECNPLPIQTLRHWLNKATQENQ